MTYPPNPQYPGQQPQGYPQQGPPPGYGPNPPQQQPPYYQGAPQQGPPAPAGYGPPAPAGYGPPQGYDQGGYGPPEPNWQAMADGADTSTGGDYEPGWWPAHAITCEYGLTRKQDKYCWTPVFQFDGGPNNGRKMTTTLSISETLNDGSSASGLTAKLYRQVGALGVPVGEKFGQPGVTPFWQMGWTGEQVAGVIAQTGAPVEIQVYYDKDWGNFKIGGIRTARNAQGRAVAGPPMQAQAGPPAPGMQQGPPMQAPQPAQAAPQGYPGQPAQAPPQQYAAPQPAAAGPPPQQWQPGQGGIPPQNPMAEFQPGTTWNPGQPGPQQGPPPQAPQGYPQQAPPQAGPPAQAPGPMQPPNGYPPQQGQPQPGQPPQGSVPPSPWRQ